ncbi:MAG: tetraacyldisaccharide 4'-kinase [Rhodospirillales bacterium]|nr:tetraacyldisaccharide 4'-kinase [Rhodospirillales bacterium]
MRAPGFWCRDGFLARLLSPLGAVYTAAGRRRQRRARPKRLPIPVICIGNLVAGGAGKTPVALAVAAAVKSRGLRPCFLTRGFGGSLAGPLWVDPLRQNASEVGDEPLLLARAADCVVSADRPLGADLALTRRPDVLILDDGFQNPSLAKDLSLLVVDSAYGFGNGRVLPAGPLREPLKEGLARANALVLLDGDEPRCALDLVSDLPRLEARLAAEGAFDGRRVFAFAGIGRPGKFYASLKALGAELVGSLAFPDHHRYSAAELSRLKAAAEAKNAALITTEKDLVRIDEVDRKGIASLPVAVTWQDPETLAALLAPLLDSRHRG